MTKLKVFALSIAMLCLSVVSFGQGGPTISIAVSGPQLATANGTPGQARPGRLASYTDGRYLLVDTSNTANQRIYIVNPAANPATLTKVTDTVALRARVDADNGAAPAPTNMSVAAISADQTGMVYVATDGADPETAYLFRVNPTSGVVDLLSGLDGVPSTIEGLSNMCVFAGNAYINLVSSFGSLFGEAIVRLPTNSAPGGRTKATVFVAEPALLAAVAPTMSVAMRSLLPRPGRMTLVTANSANAAANDDFLEFDVASGAISVLVRATDIEGDLSTVDIGQSSFTFDSDGTIYMANQFGTPANAPPDKSIVKIANPNAGAGVATDFATQAQIIASPLVRDLSSMPVTSLGFVSNAGILALGKDDVLFSDTNSRNVIRIKR